MMMSMIPFLSSYLFLGFSQVVGQTSFLQRSYPLDVSEIQAPERQMYSSPVIYIEQICFSVFVSLVQSILRVTQI